MFQLIPIPRFLIIFSVLFIACNDSGLIQQPKNIETAKQKWESSGYSDYSMEVDRSCYCALPSHFTAIIENNKVVQIIDAESGEKMDQTAGYSTIDELFTWLERVAPEDPEKLELEFHPTLGYPTFIDYNQSDMIADEELLMRITNLERK